MRTPAMTPLAAVTLTATLAATLTATSIAALGGTPAAAATLSGLPSAAASPAPDCQRMSHYATRCRQTATSPGTDGGVTVEGASSASSGGRMCRHQGRPIPCSRDGGWWNSRYGCYLRPAPVTGEGMQFRGNQPGGATPGEDGAFFACVTPDGRAYTVFAPVGDPAVAVDPETVARIAVEQLDLLAIDIGITPEPGPDSVGLVGLPVWMWAADPRPQTWGPITSTAAVGAVSVTATARVTRVDWDMADGTTVTCDQGTPYTPQHGDSESPDCGHRYTRTSAERPGQVYPVTATSQWEVTWTGSGASGTIPVTTTAVADLRIGEMQVLITQ